MARTTSAQALLDRIRARCDSRTIRQDNTILIDWINEAIAELWEVVSNANPRWRFEAFTPINIVAGTQDYGLPDACFRVGRVDLLLDTGDWVPITNCQFMEVEFRTSTNRVGTRVGMRYALNGERLYFERNPSWSKTGGMKIWGTPIAPKFDTGNLSETMDFFNGWDRYVVNKVIVDWAQADQRTVEAALALLTKAEQEVLSAATRKDIGQGKRLRLVDPGRGIGSLRRRRWHPYD